MKRNFGPPSLAAVSLICILLVAGCSNNNLVLRYVTITPQTATATVGGSQVNFTAQAYYSNGTVTDGTGLVLWSSSNPAVATVQGGVATPLTPGTTTISATASGTPGATAVLTVNQVTTIAITPATQTVPQGGSQQYDAVATFNDGTTADVTTQATWSSTNASVTIGASTGLATVANNATVGSTSQISALLNGVSSNTATLTVGAPVAVSLVVTPATPQIAVGTAVDLTAMEMLSNGNTQPASAAVTWASGTTTTATVAALPTSTNTSMAAAYGVASSTTPATITATEGTLTGTTQVTVATGSTHFAYVSNTGSLPQTIEWFNVTASTSPYLAPPSGTNTINATSTQTVINPNGQYLYYTDAAIDLNVLAVNPMTGALTTPSVMTPIGAFGGPSLGVSGSGTTFIAVDPFGRFVYVADVNTSIIAAFAVNSDGSLTAVSGSPFSVNTPAGIVIDPTGSYLYATNNGNNTISQFSITQSGASAGALTALSPATQPTGSAPLLATLDPSGTHVYVADSGDSTVAAFTIGSGGLLTQVGSGPVAIPTAVSLLNVLVDPAGANIYILDSGAVNAAGDGQVFGFAITPSTGAINTGSPVSGTPMLTGNFPTGGFVIDPTGKIIASENSFDNTISIFTITSGAVASGGTVGTGSSPLYVTFYNAAP